MLGGGDGQALLTTFSPRAAMRRKNLADEIVIKTTIDPDFGELQLVETRSMAGVGGGPMKSLVFRHWSRPPDSPGPSILISEGDDPLSVSEQVRQDFRRVTGDVETLKKQVAHSKLELAREWAHAGELDIELTENSFAKLLALDGYSIDFDRLTVWLSESADIFAGHVIEVRIETGTITEICLAG